MLRSLFNFALAMGIVMLTMGLLTGTLQAQGSNGTTCSDRASMIHTLEKKYGESRLGVGITKDTLIEIWINKAEGTWTILKSYPNGRSCVMDVGTDWVFGLMTTTMGVPS